MSIYEDSGVTICFLEVSNILFEFSIQNEKQTKHRTVETVEKS